MFDKNKEYLKKYYGDLYDEVIDHELENRFELIKNKDESYNILVDGKVNLHSKYNPNREAKSFIDGFELEREDTILVFGLGLGYYLDILIEDYNDKKIIIIEPSLDIFIKAMKVHDFSQYFKDENIVFIVNKDKYTIRNLIEHYIKNTKIKSIYFKHLPSYKKLFEVFIGDVYNQISKLVSSLHGNLATEISSSNRWIYNFIRNMKFFIKYNSVDEIKNFLKGIPVVIVSAGPSLDKNLHLLKDLDKKALIIAAGSSANILEKNNIIPHIILGVDGNKGEGQIFKNLRYETPLMVYNHGIYYESLIDYKGNKMWITLTEDTYMNTIFEKFSIDIHKFLIGGSVANLALDFAVWLESSCIVFLGQDLCYTSDKLYADGAVHQTSLEDKNGYIKKIDIYGRKVYTRSAFINFKNWFEDYIDYNELKEGIYNCTEGGLEIKGIPNRKFKDIINEKIKKDYNIEEVLKSLSQEKTNIDQDEFNKLMDKYHKEIKGSINISKKRIEILKDLENKIEDKKFNELFDKLMKETKRLEGKMFFKDFIKRCGNRYREAIEMSIYSAINELDDINEKRKKLLEGLMLQYEDIHKKLEVSLDAFEEREVEGLF